MQQTLLDFDELTNEGVPNPFYDPDRAEQERLFDEQTEKELRERERLKQKQIEDGGLEYKICCAHVSKVDGSAYAVKILNGYTPEYVVYSDGLSKGVEPKRCECNGKCDGWRGGELVNQLYDRDGGCIDE